MKFELPEFAVVTLSAISITLSLVGSCHVVLHKRDSRSATGWAALIWLAPILGSLLYYLLGINRLRRRASRMGLNAASTPSWSVEQCKPRATQKRGDENRLGLFPFQEGNVVQPLWGGRNAYPEMLEAIESARQSVELQSYIFDSGPTGDQFVAALGHAADRGVMVRVLIDGLGSRTSPSPVADALARRGVHCVQFLPTRLWLPGTSNLRNHRKLLLIDRQLAFTGGMNLREGNVLASGPDAIRDLQFRVEGPVVAQLTSVFDEDWAFATDEVETPLEIPPTSNPVGRVRARAVPDGPDDPMDRLRYTMMAGIARARKSVRVMTPYFLPDRPMIAALNMAALSGAEVDIIIPERSNLPFFQWASTATLWQVLEFGCRVWASPGVFEHSKLLVVDDEWSLIGSANLDPRSLRLNFELCLECEDPGLASSLARTFEQRRRAAREITLEEVDGRSLPVRLRDGFSRLLTPYL